MDSVRIVEFFLMTMKVMAKVMPGSGFVVTGVMGGIASLATSLLRKTLFLMSTIVQSACKMFMLAEIM